MSNFVKMLSHRKGDASDYRPTAGTRCLISGPNCDDENGYTYGEYDVLWSDDLFVVFRKEGCWPVINKWEHIIAKPLTTSLAAPSVASAANGDDMPACALIYSGTRYWSEDQIRAAVLAERAACAKLCDDQANEPECPERATYCADAIRARN